MSLFCRRIFPFSRQFYIPTNPQIYPASIKPLGVASTPRFIHISSTQFKVRKNDKKQQQNPDLNIAHASHAHNRIVDLALKDMEDLEVVLEDELVKHFSAKVDLRVYEEIVVVLDNGEEHRLNRLGRVSLKSPQMVMINFADNPTAIKAAKTALMKSSLAVNPQHEGIILYIPVPRMTRERREELANAAKTKMFNDFKEALNKVYVKYDKKSAKESKTPDAALSTRNLLLATKRALENRGLERITAQQKALMKEVA